MKIDSVHAEFMSGNAVSSSTSSHSIVVRDASGDIQAAGVTIAGNSGTLFSYSDGTRTVYGGCNSSNPWFGTSSEHDLRLVTHSNERMRIDSTGNIGIGTSSPFEKLDVRGAIIAPVVSYADNQDAPYLIASSTSYTGATTNWGTHGIQHKIKTDSSGTPRITVDDGNGNEVFTIKNGGNIGIGTSNPSAGKLDIFVPDGETGIHIRGGNYGTDNGEAHIRIGGGGVSSSNISHHAMITGGHTSTGSSYLSFSTLLDYGTHGNNPVERMRINQYGNVGIGTASPYGKLGIYTGSTATAGLTIDRHSSGTYRSELYQESNGLAIKVGDGTNAPTENMRITSSTTATPGKLTVGTGTASSSQMFVYAAGDGSTTSNTDLHVTPNGQMIMYGTRPWVTTTNTQGTLDRQCYISLHAGGHQPAIEWTRNNGQLTNQRNWLLRQETDDTLYLWHYNGSTWGTPFVFNKDGKLGVGTASPNVKLDVVGGNIGLDYGQAIEVSPNLASVWTSGTTKLIETGWGTGDEVRFFTPGSQSAAQQMVINSNGRVGIGLGTPSNTLDVRGGLSVSYADNNAMIIDGGGTFRRHYVHSSVNHGAGLHFTSSAIWATDYAGVYNNGGINWGSSSYRWNNIYTEHLDMKGYLYCDPDTSTKNSPTDTGVYVYNSQSGDACLAARVKDVNAGDPYVSFDVAGEAGWSIGMDNSDSNRFKLANSWNDLTTNTKLTVTTDGFVGIGVTNPDAALHVEGAKYRTLGTYNSYYSKSRNNQSTWSTHHQSGNATFNWGIYARYYIGTAEGFVHSSSSFSASDERIKKNIVDADDAECLETLRLLKPKKYQYRDVIKRGEEPVWGFIAQEVKETLPYATKFIQDVTPNIYELANVSSSNVITFTNFNTSNLESNATTLIRTKGIDNKDHDIHLAEIIDEHTIRVEEDLSAWTGSVDETGNVVAGNQLFVYGQQVDDFVYIQKEAIWTVTTAALQEVDRQLQAEKVRNDALERRVEELESMVSLIKLNMTWPDA